MTEVYDEWRDMIDGKAHPLWRGLICIGLALLYEVV